MRLCKVCDQPLPEGAHPHRKYHKHCGDLVEREQKRQNNAKSYEKRMAEIKADPEAHEAFLERERQSNAKRMAEIKADPEARAVYLEQARQRSATKAQQEEYLRYIAFLAAIKKLEEREGLGGEPTSGDKNNE